MTQRVLCEKKSLLFLVDIAREQNYFNTTYIYIYIYIYIYKNKMQCKIKNKNKCLLIITIL
jgi:hypothetical protein